MDNLYTF